MIAPTEMVFWEGGARNADVTNGGRFRAIALTQRQYFLPVAHGFGGSEGASGTRSRPSPTRLLREIPSTNSVQLVEIIISELLDTALRDSAGF